MKKTNSRSSFPEKTENLPKEECAKILQRALASSARFLNIKQLANVTGINKSCLRDYFSGRHKPPQKRM